MKVEKQQKPLNGFKEERFEFLLYINDNIICQRFFNINHFNEKFLKSYELKEMMDNLCGVNNGEWGYTGLIPTYLKKKSVNYLWDSFNPYYEQTDESFKAQPKKGDILKFEFKVDKRVVAASIFENNFFTLTPKVGVDIREIISSIIDEIRVYSTQKKYTIVEANALV